MVTKFTGRKKTLSQIKAEKILRMHTYSGETMPHMVYVCHIKRHPFLHGVGSLGNVSGGYSRLRFYLRGNCVQDMRNDWLKVGDAFRESLQLYKK